LRAVRAALIAAFVLVIGCLAAVFVSQHAIAAVARGDELTYPERLALFAWNSYIRSAPFVTLAVVGAAAILGTLPGGPASYEEVRRERRGWVTVGAVALASEYSLIFVVTHAARFPAWSVVVFVPAVLFVVSCFGVLIATIRLHRFRVSLTPGSAAG
jgi:hypothetical protein